MKRLLVILLLWLRALTAQQTISATFPIVVTPTVATPSFSPAGGTYSSTQTVTISTTTPLAVLCYTTDGTTPTEVSHLCSGGTTSTYSTPISVTTTQTVKVIGTLAGYTDSAVGSATYTISAGFSDSFPYSAGDLAAVSGGNWTYNGTPDLFTVVTGSPKYIVATNVCSSNTCFAAWTGVGSFTPSQYASVTFGTISSNQGNAGPAVEVSTSAQTGYQLECESGVGNGCFLAKSVAGSRTLLVYPPVGTVSSGDIWAIQAVVSGSSVALTVYQNGSLVSALSYTDSSSAIVSGVPGMFGQQGNPPQIVNAAGGSGVYP
jgi:hypothetical protein